MEAFLLCCTAIFAGPLFDRGYARPMVLTGSFMVVFGFMMTSLGSEYWQLMLSQGICMGIGHGFLFITSIAIVPSYFTTKRSFAIGLAASGSSFGAVIYTVTFHHLTSHHGLSFGWAIRILGFIALATLAIPCVALRPLKPTGPPHRSIVDFSGFRELPFALFSAASFIGTIGIYIPFFYLSLFAASKAGFDADLAFIMLPILSAGSVIGRIAPGFIADFVGPLNVLTLCTMIAGLFGFCWIGVVLGVSLGGLVMWSFLYGIFSGAFVSLQPSIVVSITDDLGMVGGRVGMNTFCAALGSLIGNPIAGFLLAKDPSWTALQAFCGATLFVGSALMVVTRWSRVGLGFAKKA
jgi:predicted MFS family arabinose efflux permease